MLSRVRDINPFALIDFSKKVNKYTIDQEDAIHSTPAKRKYKIILSSGTRLRSFRLSDVSAAILNRDNDIPTNTSAIKMPITEFIITP